MRVGDIALYGQGWADYVAGVFDVPVDVLLTGVERVVRKANMASWNPFTPGMVFHPTDWAEVYEPLYRRCQQPWMWVYPPLVVDREKLAVQIEALLDPGLALRTWVYDQFGLVVNPRQAEMIAAIEQGKVHIPEHWKAPL